MNRYSPGDIVILLFPFTDKSSAKRRPALVLYDSGDEDVIVARITGQSQISDFDLEISEWDNAGLLMPSIVRLHKIATFEKSLIEKKLGKVTANDWSTIEALIHKFICN